MTDKVTLAELGITNEEIETFITSLMENNLVESETDEEFTRQLMILYIKTITSAKTFADALGIENVNVILEGEE